MVSFFPTMATPNLLTKAADLVLERRIGLT
jgi:hypothetical protein